MKYTFIIMLAISTLQAAGQNHLVGIKGGMNWTSVSSDIFSDQTDHRQGISGGLTYDYFYNENFSIGVDVLYSQRGFKNEMIFMDDLGRPTGEKAILKFNYDYLSLPLKVGYSTRSSLFSFANVGIVPAILVDAKTTTPTFDADANITGTETFNITSSAATFDLAGLVELGVGYKIMEELLVNISFSYQHSLTSISNANYFSDRKIIHNGRAVNIGLKWTLKKNNGTIKKN